MRVDKVVLFLMVGLIISSSAFANSAAIKKILENGVVPQDIEHEVYQCKGFNSVDGDEFFESTSSYGDLYLNFTLRFHELNSDSIIATFIYHEETGSLRRRRTFHFQGNDLVSADLSIKQNARSGDIIVYYHDRYSFDLAYCKSFLRRCTKRCPGLSSEISSEILKSCNIL